MKRILIFRCVLCAVFISVAAMTAGCRSHSDKGGDGFCVDSLLSVSIPEKINSQIIEYPGFIMSFNPDLHIPNWVAWELTANEMSTSMTSRRNHNFAADEKVPGSATLEDYKRSGYSRGHMAPAGDMRWSKESMDACFLLTNMCPQATELNNGAWKNLEEKCRQWAIRDGSIVIICGPVLNDKINHTIGQSKVAVPEQFFKVVLAPYANPPRAIGFIMPNGYVPGGMQASAVSVDQVETITGYDFFEALPDSIENLIEAECNFPRWSRR